MAENCWVRCLKFVLQDPESLTRRLNRQLELIGGALRLPLHFAHVHKGEYAPRAWKLRQHEAAARAHLNTLPGAGPFELLARARACQGAAINSRGQAFDLVISRFAQRVVQVWLR